MRIERCMRGLLCNEAVLGTEAEVHACLLKEKRKKVDGRIEREKFRERLRERRKVAGLGGCGFDGRVKEGEGGRN